MQPPHKWKYIYDSAELLIVESIMAPRLTQAQKDVLSLYRQGLRLIRTKPEVHFSRRTRENLIC